MEEPLIGVEDGTVSMSTTDETSGSDMLQSSSSSRTVKRAARPSVKQCLNATELADVELDVYNMFYISDLWSQSFFYSIAVLVTKMTLYIILIIDLMTDANSYPFERKKEGTEVKLIVIIAQLFLLPVAIMVQEELMVSFFTFGNLQYTSGILKRHSNAYRWKYHAAHSARALDGLMFLYINVYLMLSSVNLLSIFLNFSALMFLQQIDNIALKLCLDGYWTRSLQECARDTVELKIAFKQNYAISCLRGRTTILWVSAAYIILLGFWVKVHFIDR